MKVKTSAQSLCSLLAMLTMIFGVQQPLAAKNHAAKKNRKESRSEKICGCLTKINATTKQDLLVDNTTLNVVNQINSTTQADLLVDQTILDIVSCGAAIPITQEMVSAGLVITEPGVYQFCENITFSPGVTAASASMAAQDVNVEQLKADIKKLAETKKGSLTVADVEQAVDANTNATAFAAEANPVTAITIAASNVYIDMKNFTLQQGDGSPGVVGYWLTPGYENISIVNGSIQHFLGAGIASYIDVPENPQDQVYLRQLLFNNLTIVDNGGFGNPSTGARAASGIVLNSVNGIPNFTKNTFVYQDVQILNCNINRNTGSAVRISHATDVICENTHVDYTYVGTFPLGFYLRIAGFVGVEIENIILKNSTFNHSQYQGTLDDALVVFVAGSWLGTVRNLIIDDCQFNNTSADSIFVNGIQSGTIGHAFVQNSQFNNPTGIGASCQFIEGWHMSDAPNPEVSGDGYRVVNCQFNNSYSEQGTFGYCQVGGTDFITCKDIVFENCQAMGSTLVGDFPFQTDTRGFSVGTFASDGVSPEQTSARNVTFRNVTVGDISGPQKVVGIACFSSADPASPIIPTSSNYTVEGAIIGHIRTSHESLAARGIEVAAAENAFFYNVFVKNNRVSDVYSTNSQNTASAGIAIFNINRPNISNNSISDCTNGIVLDNSVNGVVIGNEVDYCPNTGIWDTLAPTTSMFSQNKVTSCGTPSTDLTNYKINWGIPAPIDSGSLTTGYPATSNAWNNLSMKP